MFGLGIQELLIILAIAVLLFGARRLPEVGKSLGAALRGFKAGVSEEGAKAVGEGSADEPASPPPVAPEPAQGAGTSEAPEPAPAGADSRRNEPNGRS